jgi:hypothetical protein
MLDDYTLTTISVVLGTLSVANKWLLFRRAKAGWTSGMIIGVGSAVYFSVIGLELLAAAELAFFGVMLYGLFVAKINRNQAITINLIVIIASAILAVMLYNGIVTVAQFLASFGFVWGGYCLAASSLRIGWAFFLMAHVATGVAALAVGQGLFASLQGISAAVSGWALLVAFSADQRTRPTG